MIRRMWGSGGSLRPGPHKEVGVGVGGVSFLRTPSLILTGTRPT